MAFSDPQAFPMPTAGANSLVRIASDPVGAFQKADGTVTLKFAHAPTKGGRVRHSVEVTHSKVAADPFTSGLSRTYSMTARLVIDVPALGGYTVAEQKDVIDGLVDYLDNTSGANVTKVLANEK